MESPGMKTHIRTQRYCLALLKSIIFIRNIQMSRNPVRADLPYNPQTYTFNNSQQYPYAAPPQATHTYATPGYLTNNTTYLPASMAVTQPEHLGRVSIANTTRGSIPLTQYQHYPASESIVYGANPPIHGSYVRASGVSHGQRQLRTSYVPVVNYVPIVQQVPEPIIEPEISRVSHRMIVHEPQIYEKRETRYEYPKETLAPTRTVIQQEVNFDPMVETVRGPSWGGDSVRGSKSRVAPPPAVAKPEKPCCPWWGWLLLGLLALTGLILAIVFGTKHGGTTADTSARVAAVAPSTIDIKSNATTTQTNTSTSSRPASVQPSADLTTATVTGSTATTQPIEANYSSTSTSTVAPATNVVQPISMEPTTTPSTSIRYVEPTTASSSTSSTQSTGSSATTVSTTSGYTTSTATSEFISTPSSSGSVQPSYASSVQPTQSSSSGSVQPTYSSSSGSVQPTTTQPASVQPTTVSPTYATPTGTSSGSNNTTTNSSSSTTTTTTTTTTSHALVARRHHL